MRPEGGATLAGLSQMFGSVMGASMTRLNEQMRYAAESMKRSQEALLEMQMRMKPITITITAKELEALFGAPSVPTLPGISKPRKPKGVKATLKTTGPPFTGRWREGDLVKDRKGDHWNCTASGKPGSWERA